MPVTLIAEVITVVIILAETARIAVMPLVRIAAARAATTLANSILNARRENFALITLAHKKESYEF